MRDGGENEAECNIMSRRNLGFGTAELFQLLLLSHLPVDIEELAVPLLGS